MSTTSTSMVQTLHSLTERLNACTASIPSGSHTYQSLMALSTDERYGLTQQLEHSKLSCHHLRQAYLEASALIGTLLTREPEAPVQQFKDHILEDMASIDDHLITLTMQLSLLDRVQRHTLPLDDPMHHQPYPEELRHA